MFEFSSVYHIFLVNFKGTQVTSPNLLFFMTLIFYFAPDPQWVLLVENTPKFVCLIQIGQSGA